MSWERIQGAARSSAVQVSSASDENDAWLPFAEAWPDETAFRRGLEAGDEVRVRGHAAMISTHPPGATHRRYVVSRFREISYQRSKMPSETTIPIATREVRAVGPGPDSESLRVAYLELLKLTLCDLAGAGTVSVGRTQSGRPFTRELAGEDLKLRSGGQSQS